MTVDCEEHLSAFYADLDGGGGRSERAAARRHFGQCLSCRAEAERLGHLHGLLADERRRRSAWLADGRAVRPASPWLGAFAAALALVLFIVGISLEKPWSSAPRLAVLAGDVRVDGRPARLNERMRVGAVVRTGENGSVTLRYGDGAWLRLSAHSEIFVTGGSRGMRGLQLNRGWVLGEVPESGRPLVIASELGGVRAGGTVFELSFSPRLAGAALDTPRMLRLAVARGSTDIELAGAGGRWAIPAGLSVRSIGGLDKLEVPQPLLAAEWERMLNEKPAPAFADSTLPADKVPAGVWVPRWPGRNGPTPGSRAGVSMVWSQELGGSVLPGNPERGGESWCYDARADRWRSVTGRGAEAGTGQGSDRICALKAAGLPGAREGAAMAYSPKADAVLLFGGRGAESGTWVYRCGENRWERLRPPANPPPRAHHALCYDPAADFFVLYGGEGPGGVLDDVWVFRLGR